MGYYNVVEPCVVGQLHYARPTAQPIQVDDEVAEPLVEAGSLTPYPSGKPEAVDADAPLADPVESETGQVAQRASRRSRRSED